ncbi:hypothetical protein QTP88_021331 [Uroleucon formosanum]
MIKLSELKKDILVDETTVYKLTGINSQPVYTIGSVVLRIQLGTKDTTAVFQVTHDNFPIAEAEILGAPFLRDNEININFRTSTLSIDSPNHPEPRESIPTITLQPRSETLVPVLTDVEDRTTLIIHSQNIGKKGILMGNVVNHLRDVQHDILKESVYPCNHTGEQQEEDSRIARLTRVIQTEHLNSEERASLLRICKKYQDIFHFEGEPLSFTTAIQHDIKTPEGTAPVNIRPYRLPYAHRQVIVEQMEKLEQENIIQPSESPWNAPLVVVPKKPDANGKPQFRVCVDFRRLNQLTIGDAFPIPRIDEILDQLGRSRYYTTLDLASGYHQVPIRPQDCEKTGFSTDKGHFEFVRMPFGLCGAPSTFQRLMNNVLTGLNGTKAFVYLDDIIIYAVDLVQHEARLEEVFQRLREFNLQLQPSKCQFLRHEVVYLGHLITDAGVKPDPTKISCVRDHPVPRNPTEIKRFLGLSGYYRRFIEKYSQIAKPMTTLLKKGQPFEWTAECQTAFETLVQKLVTAPILQYPNFEEPFILTTDASQYAIGSIISQGEIGHDLPIAYASRTLNKAEQNYSTTEKELLSIVWSVKHFRPYLLGRKFRIYTDHQPLTWLFNVKDPGSRLMRWRLKLAEYQYEVIYKPGATNTNADALSRMGQVMLNSTSTTYIQMNFEHHGPVKMSHFNWNLVAYVNLADPGYKYQSIRSQYEATAEICELMTERFGSTEISNACEQFVQLFARATLPYLYEIETSHRNMLLSIGDKDTGKVRARRGLAHTVQQVANVLYGMYSSIDTEFIFNKIIALSQNKSQNINLNLERMRIMQVETDNQVKEISQHEEKLEENLRYLQKQTEIIIQELDRIEFKTRLLEQALLFEILLNQYSYEIQNLMSIINSAMNGKIHTSVFTSDRLLVELREIKMNLAVGTALPLEIKAESLTGFLQVSDLTIFHREHYLVFSIEIPLTSVEEYTMYHPIPLPIIYNENTIALISPEVDYLALSNDDENFISLGVSQWEECTKLGSYTLCKSDQPIHYRAGSNLCELSHLISLESPLKDCGVKLVTLEAPIWHRLSEVNSWLYYTQRELCTIMCPDPPQTFRVEISGVGRLTVSPSCEIHTENSILVPFSKTNRDIKLDLIPENQKFNIKSMLTETLSSVLPQTLSNVKIFNNLNSLAHKALELSKLEPKSIEPLFIFKIEFHITILYISLTFFVLVISALAIRFRNRVTKMYTPEVAENIFNNDQDGL